MTPEERIRVMEKIENLLRLSESSNPHEAAVASTKVAELLQKYNLTLEEIEPQGKREFSHDSFIWESKVFFTWESVLAGVLQNHFSCQALIHRRRRSVGVSFIGRSLNVEACLMTFKTLREQFKVGASLAWTEEEDKRGMDDRAYRNSWITGALVGLKHALEALKASSNQQTTALVTMMDKELQDYMNEEFPDIQKSDNRSLTNHYDSAYFRGYDEGLRSMTHKLGE